MRKVLVLCFVVILSGCELSAVIGKSSKVIEQSKPVISATTSAVANSEPVVAALEQVTGKTIPLGIAESGESAANKAETVLRISSGLASVVPGGQVVADGLTALSVLAGGIGMFFGRRKAAALKSVVKAVDVIPGAGKIAKVIAMSEGTSATVEKAYLEVKKGSS